MLFFPPLIFSTCDAVSSLSPIDEACSIFSIQSWGYMKLLLSKAPSDLVSYYWFGSVAWDLDENKLFTRDILINLITY